MRYYPPHYIALLLSFWVTLGGCTQPFEVGEKGFEEQLYLFGYWEMSEEPNLRVTNTIRVEEVWDNIEFQAEAKVDLYENDVLVGTMKPDSIFEEPTHQFVLPGFVQQPSTNYRLEVAQEGYPTATVNFRTAQIPQCTAVRLVEKLPTEVSQVGDTTCPLIIEYDLEDRNPENNYYQFSRLTLEQHTWGSVPLTHDPAFEVLSLDLEEKELISDQDFVNGRLTVRVKVWSPCWQGNTQLISQIWAYPNELARNFRDEFSSIPNSENPFFIPQNPDFNVVNGLGFVETYSELTNTTFFQL